MPSRVIVDEGVGRDSALWKQFQRVIAGNLVEYLFLKDAHPGIPDVEILDKLLQPNDIVLTTDRVLHAHVLDRGCRSYTLNEHGEITRKQLAGVKTTQLPGSAHHELQSDYHHQPESDISERLKGGLSNKHLKRYRTARRRIRGYFGSAAAIGQISLTIGMRVTSRGMLCGCEFNIAGYSGVAGLRASEGYCRAASGQSNPACPLLHALREQFLLQLEQIQTELFIIPVPCLELSRRLLESPAHETPEQKALWRLLNGVAQITLHPCVKGRFFDRMERKLEKLDRNHSNEVTTIDFAQMTHRLLCDMAIDEF